MKGLAVLLGIGAWAIPVALGVRYLDNYEVVAGRTEPPLAVWPVESGARRVAGVPTIVMALHAECPCSKASMAELRSALEHSNSPVSIDLLVYNPKNPIAPQAALDWPGVSVLLDEKGLELARFHAKVSGEVWMYSSSGTLQFHGGVTGARGHEGRNAGGDAISAILNGTSPRLGTTPVFGCSLVDRRTK